jgi:protoporphyrinogen oxidase
MAKNIVIVGGGIAGLTAAYSLMKQGRAGARPFDVTILEAEKVPGGQARAFKKNGLIVEHGSHVFFTFYDTIIKLIDELRRDPELAADMPKLASIPGWTIVDAYGNRATLEQSSWLPEPYNVFPSILRIPWLSLWDRICVGLGALKVLSEPYERFAQLDQQSSHDLAIASGYTEIGAVAWNSASLGLTNLFIGEQSGALFCAKHKVLIQYPKGLSYQLPAGDLSELFANPMKKKLDKLGARTITSAEVQSLSRPAGEDKTRVTYRTHAGEHTIEADQVILAVRPQCARELVPWVDAPWTQLQPVTPVLTVVLVLSELVQQSVDDRELGLSREQWAFSVVTDLSHFWPEYEGSQKTVLRCEIGHADRLPGGPETPDREVMAMVKLDLERLFPEIKARRMTIEKFAIHRETKHLYTRWEKGAWSKKPTERDVGQGIYLAGDWTTKGTIGMEAAANSGLEAANQLLIAAGIPPIPFRDTPL